MISLIANMSEAMVSFQKVYVPINVCGPSHLEQSPAPTDGGCDTVRADSEALHFPWRLARVLCRDLSQGFITRHILTVVVL